MPKTSVWVLVCTIAAPASTAAPDSSLFPCTHGQTPNCLKTLSTVITTTFSTTSIAYHTCVTVEESRSSAYLYFSLS